MMWIAGNRLAGAILLQEASTAMIAMNRDCEAGWGVFCRQDRLSDAKIAGFICENSRSKTMHHGDEAETWGLNWMPMVENQTTTIDRNSNIIKDFVQAVQYRSDPIPVTVDR